MTVTQILNQDHFTARFVADHSEAQTGHDSGVNLLTPTLLHDPRLAIRGNAPARAVTMHAAQQRHGNRAVQRVMHAHQIISEPSILSLRPVQRWFVPSMNDEMSGLSLKHGGNLNPTSMLKTPTPAGPVPIPYPNMGASPGGGMMGGLGGLVGGMDGMMGAIMGGGLDGIMGGLGGMLGDLAGGGASRMSNGDEAGTMNEIEMFKIQQTMNRQTQQVQMMSNIMKKQDEMQKSIMGNFR